MFRLARQSAACLALWLCGCSFSPSLLPYQLCDEQGACPADCQCVEDWICMSDLEGVPPWECSDDPTGCQADSDCRLGCHCADGICEPAAVLADRLDADYCLHGLEPTCRPADWLVDITADEEDGGPTNDDPLVARQGAGLSLREALILAAHRPGVHRIGFGLPGNSRRLTLTRNLPAVPSLTFLDGGEQGVALVGNGASVGLEIDGHALALGRLALSGFGEVGVRVAGGSSDVHLFSLRVGEPARPNGIGIDVQPGCQRVVLGRARELACIPEHLVPAGGGQLRLDEYDLNLVIANQGHGIQARQVEQLRIYGTWVGHSPTSDFPDSQAGNGGTGILLEQVNGAELGAFGLDSEYAALGEGRQVDLFPAFVAVGRNRAGGVWIRGGGQISMPGLILGDTPALDIYHQNEGFNLRIERNTGPVVFGPDPTSRGYPAGLFGLIFTADATPVEILQPAALVQIVRSQIVSIDPWPQLGLRVEGNTAEVELIHLSFTSNVDQAAVLLEDVQAPVEVVNCLFRGYYWQTQPVFAGAGLDSGLVEIRNNMGFNFGRWSDHAVPDPARNLGPLDDPLQQGWAQNARLLSPDSPAVDAAEDLGLDANGGRPGECTGCAPDIGAFECVSEACEAIVCP